MTIYTGFDVEIGGFTSSTTVTAYGTAADSIDFTSRVLSIKVDTEIGLGEIGRTSVEVELDKPFILLMPSSKINTSYFRAWKDKGIQIIIPKKRISFIKMKNGKYVESKGANFDCFYYCYKMNLEKDILWLE